MDIVPDFHPRLALVLASTLIAIAFIVVRRFFIRRQFAPRHGFQPVARSVNEDPFLALDKYITMDHPRSPTRGLRAFSYLREHIYTDEVAVSCNFDRGAENIKTILLVSINFR